MIHGWPKSKEHNIHGLGRSFTHKIPSLLVSLFILFTLLYACAESTGVGQRQGLVPSFHCMDSRDPPRVGHYVWWQVPLAPSHSPALLLFWGGVHNRASCPQVGKHFSPCLGEGVWSHWPLAARDSAMASPISHGSFISPTPQYVSSNKSDLFSVCAFVHTNVNVCVKCVHRGVAK